MFTIDQATELCRHAVMVTLLLCLPVLSASVIVGLIISIAQAVTQLQEQTLSFVPKLIAMMLVILFTLPWSLTVLVDYSIELFENIPKTLGG
jgi:flagellar biosynthesis protein FliQ